MTDICSVGFQITLGAQAALIADPEKLRNFLLFALVTRMKVLGTQFCI